MSSPTDVTANISPRFRANRNTAPAITALAGAHGVSWQCFVILAEKLISSRVPERLHEPAP
ncbi:hypothetical protein QFZ96_007179 [Paraburkholderia youngii]